MPLGVEKAHPEVTMHTTYMLNQNVLSICTCINFVIKQRPHFLVCTNVDSHTSKKVT